MLWFAGLLGFICGCWALASASDAWGEFKTQRAALGKQWAIDKLVSEKLREEYSRDSSNAERAAKKAAERAKEDQRVEAYKRVNAKLEERRGKS